MVLYGRHFGQLVQCTLRQVLQRGLLRQQKMDFHTLTVRTLRWMLKQGMEQRICTLNKALVENIKKRARYTAHRRQAPLLKIETSSPMSECHFLRPRTFYVLVIIAWALLPPHRCSWCAGRQGVLTHVRVEQRQLRVLVRERHVAGNTPNDMRGSWAGVHKLSITIETKRTESDLVTNVRGTTDRRSAMTDSAQLADLLE